MNFYIPLTKRQEEVMSLMAKGFRIKAIANKLCINPATVSTHLIQIYNNFGISSTEEFDVRILAINKYNQYKRAKVFFEQKSI